MFINFYKHKNLINQRKYTFMIRTPIKQELIQKLIDSLIISIK
jgi:hypothetical protein